jgi:hypothetical protein
MRTATELIQLKTGLQMDDLAMLQLHMRPRTKDTKSKKQSSNISKAKFKVQRSSLF